MKSLITSQWYVYLFYLQKRRVDGNTLINYLRHCGIVNRLNFLEKKVQMMSRNKIRGPS